MRRISSFLFACLLCLAPATGRAEGPNAQGAVALKEALSGLVSFYSGSAEAAGQSLAVSGDIAVTPKEQYYLAVLPGVTLRTDAGFRLDVGDIAVHAVPSAAAGEEGGWVLSAALPSAMPVVDAAGKTVAKIAVNGQKASGVWVPSLSTFTRLDAVYKDVSLKMEGDGPYSLSLGTLRGAINMAPDAAAWSGLRLFLIEDLQAGVRGKGETGSGSVKIGRLQSRAEMRAVSLGATKRAQDKLKALSDAGKEMQGEEAVAAMIESVGAFPDVYSARLDVADAAIGYAQGEDNLKAALARFFVSADATGLQQDKGGFAVRIGVEGLGVEGGVPKPLEGLVPRAGVIDLRLENLPMSHLGKVFSGIVQGVSQGAGPGQEGLAPDVTSTLSALPGALSAAGTQLTVGNTYLKAPDLTAALEGRLVADPSSPFAVAGTATLSLEGLDEVVTKFRQMALKQPILAPYMTGLIPLQLAGDVTKSPDGLSIRRYRFELTPDGKVMLNGADFSVVKALFTAKKPPSPDAPPGEIEEK